MADVNKNLTHEVASCFPDEDHFKGLTQAAVYSDLSVTTLRKRLAEIPHFRVGRKILFKKSEFDHWLEGYREGSEDLDLRRIADEALASILGSDKNNEGEK